MAEAFTCIIDDDEDVRDSIAFLLQTAGIDTRIYESAAAFLAAAGAEECACIVTDVRMPDISGIELLRRLNEAGRRTPVIVMTGHGDVALAVEAMKLGAHDFIEKPFDDEVFVAAVRAAIERRSTSNEVDAERAVVAARIATLSARERQVLDGLVSGNPNKVIAYDLGISPRTVEVYRANLMSKMQAASLSDLVRMALLAEGLSH